MFYLILLFTAVPLIEFSLLWWLTGEMGLPQTILLVLGTGVLGAWLARQQGVMALWRIRQQLATGQMPTDALFDGALILVAGAVLITPGVMTDAVGFALLIPPLRAIVKSRLSKWAAKNVQFQATSYTSPSQARPTSDSVIDVEVAHTRVEDA